MSLFLYMVFSSMYLYFCLFVPVLVIQNVTKKSRHLNSIMVSQYLSLSMSRPCPLSRTCLFFCLIVMVSQSLSRLCLFFCICPFAFHSSLSLSLSLSRYISLFLSFLSLSICLVNVKRYFLTDHDT